MSKLLLSVLLAGSDEVAPCMSTPSDGEWENLACHKTYSYLSLFVWQTSGDDVSWTCHHAKLWWGQPHLQPSWVLVWCWVRHLLFLALQNRCDTPCWPPQSDAKLFWSAVSNLEWEHAWYQLDCHLGQGKESRWGETNQFQTTWQLTLHKALALQPIRHPNCQIKCAGFSIQIGKTAELHKSIPQNIISWVQQRVGGQWELEQWACPCLLKLEALHCSRARSSWINDSDKKTALAAWKALGQATETRTLCLCASSALLCAKRGHSWANAWHFFFTVPLVWLPEYWEWAPKSAWLLHTCWSAFRRDLRPAASNARHMSYEGLWVCPNTL